MTQNNPQSEILDQKFPSFPFLATIQEAVELCEKERDNFFLTAFLLQAWVGRLFNESIAQYADQKDPRNRSLQTGQAWRLFVEVFDGAKVDQIPHCLSSLSRLSQYNDSFSEPVRRAFVPLSCEHDAERDYLGPHTILRAHESSHGIPLARRTIQRLCDWLDSILHLRTHELWHLAPECFDPDPEKRELAVLGVNHRFLARFLEPARLRWQWHHADVLLRLGDSPKWPSLGNAMAAKNPRPWLYPKVDAVIISLWPLVKKHNWTYRDLLSIVSETVQNPRPGYPCNREQDFATYCANVLGLRKSARGISSKTGHPPGYAIARRLFATSAS